jgi:hypothetical protein
MKPSKQVVVSHCNFIWKKKGKYKIMYTWIMNNIYTVNSFNFVENRIGLCNGKRVRLECGRSWVL